MKFWILWTKYFKLMAYYLLNKMIIWSIFMEGGLLMKANIFHKHISRRSFLKGSIAGACFSMLSPLIKARGQAIPDNPIFWVTEMPDQPFYGRGSGHYHAGLDSLLHLMGEQGLKFYRSSQETALSGPSGLIEAQDVVLIKVNAQWKYRGCTNSDLIRGLIQRILNHPDGFDGEVVIFENGQGSGNLNCDRGGSGYPDTDVHANANDESQSFLYLVNNIFNDPRVSAYPLDPIRSTFIGATDHVTNGYRTYENVSYPCFTTAGGHRVELQEGIWQGNGYSQNLKLINVPVLKHHDTGGSEITASLKHFYGVLSMVDGVDSGRHYSQLGNTCGKMVVSVRTPILNIIDATWVSVSTLSGYPPASTFRANQILASQDPVALDYWAAKYTFYPINNNARHHPNFPGINQWLTQARDIINARGGLSDPGSGILVDRVTKDEAEMEAHQESLSSSYAYWNNIPGRAASSPTLAWNPMANKPQIVIRASDDSLWAASFNSDGVFNNDWASIPGRAASSPALAWNPTANKLQIVVRASDDSLWTASFNSNGAFNNDWVYVPGRAASSPALAWNPVANKLQIVVRASDNSLWIASFHSTGVFNNDWVCVPGRAASSPALAWNPVANKLQMVVRASEDSLWTASFNSAGVFNHDWTSVPGRTVDSPALVWDDLASESCIMVRSSGDSIWFKTFISGADLDGDWISIPGTKATSSPGMAYLRSSDYLCVVARDSDDSLWMTPY